MVFVYYYYYYFIFIDSRWGQKTVFRVPVFHVQEMCTGCLLRSFCDYGKRGKIPKRTNLKSRKSGYYSETRI